jgi:RNA polymerase sigma-70 factor (ECF subfamily)
MLWRDEPLVALVGLRTGMAWPGPSVAAGSSNSVDRVRSAQGEDAALLDGLRRGDEQAFMTLVERHHKSLLRLAMLHVRDRTVAEEVVQDTWLGVLRGIDGFEERSSLTTWIYRILTNRAKTRAERERRQVPLSALSGPDEPEVSEERFIPADARHHPLSWAIPPRAWPHEQVIARETVQRLRAALQELPLAQQVVVGLRDVDGWSSEEVSEALGISLGNQRVLLHRARARLRGALEDYFEGG